MSQGKRAIVWFNEVTKKDIPLVGGKGANLGEMTNASIPVPPGFIVTADAYFDFLKRSRLIDKIRHLLKPLDPSDSKQLQQTATQIKQLILDTAMPPELAQEIEQAYIKLGKGPVAVRSSATAEDLPEASFAGQQRTFLNVEREKEVVAAVRECWASLYEPRAIFYRHQQGFDHFKVGIAVPVQKMVQSRTSGVMFTIEPVTSDNSKIIIEAVYGLGEAIVSGEVTPDLYVVDKDSLKIITTKIANQESQLIKNPTAGAKETNIWATLPAATQSQPKLTESEIIKLAWVGKQIEDHYHFPQDIEWAKENNEIYILQTRPVTTIKEGAEAELEIPSSGATHRGTGQPRA